MGKLLKTKGRKGITLIALVITIIVLLILSGVTVATLTGKNGILTKTTESKNASCIADDEETIKLALDEWQIEKSKGTTITFSDFMTSVLNENALIEKTDTETKVKVTFDNCGHVYIVEENGTITRSNSFVENTAGKITGVNTAETNPEAALPENATVIQGNAYQGIVMKDSNNNEWVWIEVPKSIYEDEAYNGGTSPEEETTEEAKISRIEDTMEEYAKEYRDNSFSDTWYDGCGLTETEYNNLKNAMLLSVYENGGFWVGRYEVGHESEIGTTAVIQQNKYPYNNINRSDAQTQSQALATDGKTASLMFGIQWDLMLKFIEEKGTITLDDGTTTRVTSAMLTGADSKLFGNTWDATFTIDRGQYSPDIGSSWLNFDQNDEEGFVQNKVKIADKYPLLTTGAVDRNNVLNIYDFVGNVQEWTWESSDQDATIRGGNFYNYASDYPASAHISWGANSQDASAGFRATLW